MTIIYGIGQEPNAPSITTNPAPTFRDDFSSGSNLNGRAGWTVATVTGQSAQINNITISAGAAGSTGNGGAYAFTTAPVANAVVQRRLGLGVFPSAGIADHVTVAGTFSGLGIASSYNTVGNTPTGLTVLRRFNAGVSTTVSSQGERIEPGDVVRTEDAISGADTLRSVFVNGWQIGPASVVSGLGVTLTGQFGLVGGPTMAGMLDDIQISNNATDEWIGLRMAGRVLPLNDDGSVTVRVRGTYNLTAPGRLLYTLLDRSSGADVAVAGHTRVPLPEFSASGGTFAGEFEVSAAVLASGGPFVVQVIRDRLLAGREAVAFSPRWRPGYIVLQNGQSLGVDASRQSVTTSPTWTAPANSFWINGEPTNVSTLGASWTRRQYPIGSNTAAAAFAVGLGAGSGFAVTTGAGGVSAQPISARGVGSACQNAIKEAIERAGGYVHAIRHTDGQSDLTTPQAQLIAALMAIYDDLDLFNGAPIKVQLNPIASSWYGSSFHDLRWQAIRRLYWQLTRDYPERFVLGANVLDLQHRDTLHLNNNAMGLQAFREGKVFRKALGLATHDRNGPSLASAAKISSSELRVVLDLNGADSLTLSNAAYAGDNNGGLIFSNTDALTALTVASDIRATGHTVDASPSGGQQGINFTFAGTPWTGSAFIRAAWGMNPFNRADNGTITDPVNLDFANRASMIQGVIAGEPNTALQPYFTTADATDYMVAA